MFLLPSEFCVVLLFPKTGLCAEQERRGAMVDFHFSLQRVNNENNRRRLGRAELGKLWSWRGDQPEIEAALGAATSVFYSDNPLVLLASFTGQRFWVRTVHNYQEMGDTAPWVLRRLRGQEEASRGEMVTSAWSRYSTRTME